MSDNINYEIEGFKEHRPFFLRYDEIDKTAIEGSFKNDYNKTKEGLKELIRFTAPYNSNWKKVLDNIAVKEKAIENPKYRTKNRILLAEKKKLIKEFIDWAGRVRPEIYIILAEAQLLPKSSAKRSKKVNEALLKND